jgi:hypothetical protein
VTAVELLGRVCRDLLFARGDAGSPGDGDGVYGASRPPARGDEGSDFEKPLVTVAEDAEGDVVLRGNVTR